MEVEREANKIRKIFRKRKEKKRKCGTKNSFYSPFFLEISRRCEIKLSDILK